jgi:hypothetical protein
MALNAMEKLQNRQASKKVTFQGQDLTIYGKVGTLAYLGITPDASSLDSSFDAVDDSYTRKAHKRARWFGDTNGINVPESTVNIVRYNKSKGGVQPGKTILFRAVTDTANDPDGRKVTGSISLVGPYGMFVA